tara:strand:+ start:465 stop:2654 length:2190 start_codon:yes stop_codon:yes gene_type:complete
MANIKKSFNFRSGVQVDDDNLVVNQLGAVGIGTTVPTELLEVYGGNIKTSGSVTGINANFTSITATNLTVENTSMTGSVSGSGVNIGSPVGIITAESVSGLVTYYGDGQYLQNIPTSQWVDKDAGLGFISIYSAGNVGVSTDDPRYDFQVGGNNNVNAFEKGVGINSEGGIVATGVVTATTFKGSVIGDITSVQSNITQVESTNINTSGIVTTSNLHVTGIVTTSSIDGVSVISYPHGATTTLNVTVADKTVNHRYSGQGNAKGYYIDGRESPTLSFTAGRTYRFDISDSSNTSYALRLYYDEAATKVYSDQVSFVGTEGTAGSYLEIIISEGTPQKLYYQASSGAQLVGNSIITNSTGQVNNLNVVGILTATSIEGNITGNVLSGVSTITQVNSTNIQTTGIGTITRLDSTNSNLGITTITTGQVYNKLGIGTDKSNPQKILEISSVGISTVEIVGKESAEITLGQNYNGIVSIGESTAYMRFGSTPKSFELVNGDLGDFNSYIHAAAFTGINTGGFNWIYGQGNSKLMTLSYKGHLGINNPDPKVQLDVIGVSTFTGSVKVVGNLEIDGGSLIGGNISYPDVITETTIYNQTGISTFFELDVFNTVETNAIAIGTSRENIIEAGAIDAQFSRAFVSALGIGTNVTPSTLTVSGSISASGSVGIGTTIATSGADFARAGIPITRFMKLPQITSTQRGNLVALEPGSVIWNSTTSQIQYYDGSSWNALT